MKPVLRTPAWIVAAVSTAASNAASTVASTAVSTAASLLALTLCALTACGPRGTVDAAVPEAQLADAPWEAAFDPSEFTRTVDGRTFQPGDGAGTGERFVAFPGARVELMVPRPDGRRPLTKVAETVSGPDGTFRVGRVPPGAWAIRAVADGFVGMLTGEGLRMPGAVVVDPGGERMCGLIPVREVTGRVTDDSGRAVAGAHVEASSLGYFETGTTGADGGFALLAPASGCVVSVADRAWDVVRVTVASPGAAPVEIRTSPADPLEGFVAAAEDGRPVAGAVVFWMDDPSRRTQSDASGRFRLPVPRTGRIVAFGSHRAWKSYGLLRVGEQEIRLQPTDGVRGRVVDPAGRPLAGARIYGVTTNRTGAVERVTGPLSGPDGTFDFSWMPLPARGATAPAAVVAFDRRLGVSGAARFPSAGPVELRMPGVRSVAATLTDHRGLPVAAARISAEWAVEGLDEVSGGVLGVPLRRTAPTAPDGTARLDGVPAGRAIVVRAAAWGVEMARDVAADASDVSLDLRLPAGKRLAGRLADRAGRSPGAPGEVSVRLLDQPGVTVERSVTTGPDGVFRFDDLPPGRYQLRATAEGWDLPSGGEAAAGDEDVSILVERSATVSVRLRFDGEPAAAAREAIRVRLEEPDDPDRPQRPVLSPAGEDGRVVALGKVRPGRWRIFAEGGLWRGAVEAFDVADGEERVFELHLECTVLLRAVLRSHDGKPVGGTPVVARPKDGAKGAVQTVWSGADGAVVAAGFSAGTWEIRANPVGRAPIVTTVELPSEAELELRLPPCGDIVCRIRGASPGDPIDGFVTLTDPAGKPVFAWGDDGTQLRNRFAAKTDGSVRIRGVLAGAVRLEATVEGVRRAAKPAVVKAGESVDVDL